MGKTTDKIPLESLYCVEDRGYSTPCWVWFGGSNAEGYGRTRELQEGGRMRQAHRIMYEQRHGPIPTGLQLDHLCRVHACINPEHLEPVTNAENSRRGKSAKLTAEQAAEIRDATGTQDEIALEFGISRRHVRNIRAGTRWA